MCRRSGPARVPNQVLTEEDYKTVIDTTLARDKRIAAFNHRAPWLRAIDDAGHCGSHDADDRRIRRAGNRRSPSGREERSRIFPR